MKSTIYLIAICLLPHPFSFGQTVDNYGPFPKMSDDIYNFNYVTESYILLDKCNKIDTHTADKQRHKYYTFDLKPNAKITSKQTSLKSGPKSGIILKNFVTDSYIIELVAFGVVFNPNLDIGVVIRDRKSLEMVGEIQMLDEKLHFDRHFSDMFQTSHGYVFTRIKEDHQIISYLDKDFKVLKEIPIPGEAYPSLCSVSENDELFILSVRLSGTDSYKHHFTIVTPDGEVKEVEPNLEESFAVRHGKISYLSKSKEIEGIFQYSMASDVRHYDASKKAEGYKYFRWDLEGKIIESKSHIFTVDEVYGEYKEDLLKKYTEKNLYDDLNSRLSTHTIASTVDGSYLIIKGLTFLAPMLNGYHIIKLDKRGDFQWLAILPASTKNSANFYVTEDGNLRILMEDANSTLSNGRHEVDMTRKVNADESSVFHILFDKKNGEILANNMVDLNIPMGSKIKKIDINDETGKWLIESIQNKMHTFSVIGFE